MSTQELGSGKFGTVFRLEAEDGLKAVKVSKNHRVGSFGYQADILNEIDTILKLSPLCPHLIHGNQFFLRQDGKVEFHLELMDGKLSHWIVNTPFERRMKLLPEIIDQIGSALEYIHEQGYIHNDLKTNNILYREKEKGIELKLIDFGKSGHCSQVERYCAIDIYRLPTESWSEITAIVDECLAFGICIAEVILGRKMLHRPKKDIEVFTKRYGGRKGYNLRSFLQENLVRKEFDSIPNIFFEIFEPIFACRGNTFLCYNTMHKHFGNRYPSFSRKTINLNHLSPNTLSTLVNYIPKQKLNSAIFRKTRNLLCHLEVLYGREVTGKEVEACYYMFLPEHYRCEKLKYHLTNHLLLTTQAQVLQDVEGVIVYFDK